MVQMWSSFNFPLNNPSLISSKVCKYILFLKNPFIFRIYKVILPSNQYIKATKGGQRLNFNQFVHLVLFFLTGCCNKISGLYNFSKNSDGFSSQMLHFVHFLLHSRKNIKGEPEFSCQMKRLFHRKKR